MTSLLNHTAEGVVRVMSGDNSPLNGLSRKPEAQSNILNLEIAMLKHVLPKELEIDQRLQQASSIIGPGHGDGTLVPSILEELLVRIIKPLFTSQHSSLTSSGRKRLVSAPPTLPHQTPVSFDLDSPRWKNKFTFVLLTPIIGTYEILAKEVQSEAFSEHFYLLVPPVLNIIDDYEAESKAAGYELLGRLCHTDSQIGSGMVKRSGLLNVFIESMKTNFMMIPTLTEAKTSLKVLQPLYTAFFAVVDAGLAVPDDGSEKGAEGDGSIRLTPIQSQRNEYHTLLLRHGIFAALLHLNTPEPAGPTHVELVTFLLRQLRLTMLRLDVFAVKDFHVVIPMMKAILTNPFSLADGPLIRDCLDVYTACIEVGWVRVAERWWIEILRALVGCWINVIDELEIGPDEQKRSVLGRVRGRLRSVAKELGSIVDEVEWAQARMKLCKEEEELKEMFDEEP
jgi:hypothetical protein